MPPPPPSASYLWKFDDESGDESDNDRYRSTDRAVETLDPTGTSPKRATPTPTIIQSGDKEDLIQPLLRKTTVVDDPSTDSPVSKKKKNPVIDLSNVRKNIGAESCPTTVSPTTPRVVSDIEVGADAACSPLVSPIGKEARGLVIPVEESFLVNETDTTDDEDDPDAGAVTNSHTTIPGTTHSRKRKIGKKKKKKKKSTTAITTAPHSDAPTRSQRRVSFVAVNLYSFARCLGVSVVPGDGGWPLGLAATHTESSSSSSSTGGSALEHAPCRSVSIDDYERAKQERLRQRFASLASTTSSLIKTNAASNLETRQWDYRRQCRNPLFGSLSETERMTLLLASSEGGTEDDNVNDLALLEPKGSARSKPSRRVTRSPSHNSTTSSHSIGSSSGHHNEHFNEVFTALDVRHVRNELEQIRNSRSMDGATGCSCRKLQVYIMPPATKNSAAGKKAHHRRMKLAKVKEELRKRKLLPPDEENTPREALELLLHEAVEKEPCCTPMSGCACVRNGIECQADTCSCWYASHQIAVPTASDSSCSVAEIQRRCGNPVAGMYAVDFAKIEAFRTNVLATMTTCPEVKA